MGTNQLLQIVLVFVVVVLPVLAGTFTITARYAARPIVDAIIRLRELSGPPPAQAEARIAAIEQELRQLREGLERLASAMEFDAQLRAGDGKLRLPQA